MGSLISNWDSLVHFCTFGSFVDIVLPTLSLWRLMSYYQVNGAYTKSGSTLTFRSYTWNLSLLLIWLIRDCPCSWETSKLISFYRYNTSRQGKFQSPVLGCTIFFYVAHCLSKLGLKGFIHENHLNFCYFIPRLYFVVKIKEIYRWNQWASTLNSYKIWEHL